MRRDVNILVRESGLKLLTSSNQVVKKMKEITIRRDSSAEKAEKGLVLLLCDDKATDNYTLKRNCCVEQKNCSSIPCNIQKAIRDVACPANLTGKGDRTMPPLLVVNANWLFDCISCASILGAKDYEPVCPIAKSLWQLCI